MLCYVPLRYVMLCYVMLCYVMLCYTHSTSSATNSFLSRRDRGTLGHKLHFRLYSNFLLIFRNAVMSCYKLDF